MVRIEALFAKSDLAHATDGLFVPCNGRHRKRTAFRLPRRTIGEVDVSFEGIEQLGVDDQSFLLAIAALIAQDAWKISPNPKGETAARLRASMNLPEGSSIVLLAKSFSLQKLMHAAGYGNSRNTAHAMKSLDRLRRVHVTEYRDGWSLQPMPLVSIDLREDCREVCLAINPRMSNAILGGQHIRIPLVERRALRSEVAKLLHFFICSYTKLGLSFCFGRAISIENLARHVWGEDLASMVSAKRSIRRKRLMDGLREIQERTAHLYPPESGWEIQLIGASKVKIRRPPHEPAQPILGAMKDGGRSQQAVAGHTTGSNSAHNRSNHDCPSDRQNTSSICRFS
jgi:hypothetical protein